MYTRNLTSGCFQLRKIKHYGSRRFYILYVHKQTVLYLYFIINTNFMIGSSSGSKTMRIEDLLEKDFMYTCMYARQKCVHVSFSMYLYEEQCYLIVTI